MRYLALLLLSTLFLSFTIIISSNNICHFRTQTQGGWGSTPHGNNPGTYLHANFNNAFPDGLIVGCAGGDSLILTSAQAVTDYLPGGGQPAVLPGTITDPIRYRNNLASQLVALSLSAGFDLADTAFGQSNTNLVDATLASGTFQGWTVQMLLDTANQILGGCDTTFSPTDISNALAQINESFVDGDPHDTTLLICQPPIPPAPCNVQINFTADTVCTGSPTTITNLSTGVDSLAMYYLDLGSDGSIDLSIIAHELPTDTSIILPITGVIPFTIYVINTDSCADTLSSSIVINEIPNLDFTTDTVCLGAPTTITNNSTGVDSFATYYFDLNNDGSFEFSANAADLPTDTSIIIPFIGTHTYKVVVENPGGCTDTLISSILVQHPDSCLTPRLIGGNHFRLIASPNPSNKKFTLTFSSDFDDHIAMKLYSTDGKLVNNLFDDEVDAGVNYRVSVEASDLPGGVYYINSTSESGINSVKRIMILE